jgi:hypothetical protein
MIYSSSSSIPIVPYAEAKGFHEASPSIDLFQVFFGLPLFLVPCGFQFSTVLSTAFGPFLILCPINIPFCFFISSSVGFLLFFSIALYY